jgi:fructose/tagatose bisphosphate aldolase
MLGMGATAVSATNPVFVELSNGATTYNAPSSSQLPAALGQTTMAASLSVAIASNQSAVPVTVSSLPTTSDTNYGAPTASTLRTASMLGMGATAVSVTNPVFVEPGNGTNSFTSAAITAAQFTQSTATAVPVEAGLAMGWDGTTHREISVSTTGVVNVASSNFPTTLDTNYGNPGSSTLRTAAMLGIGSTAVSVTNPVSVQLGNGTNNFSSGAITAAQFTQSTATAVPVEAGLAMGWDGTTHREISVSTTGGINTSLGGLAIQNFLALDTSSTNITSAAYVQLFASTTAAVSWVSIFNGSGSILELATGTAGSEVVQLVVPPGGIEARLAIAASTRVAIRRYPSVTSDMTSGFFTINLLG